MAAGEDKKAKDAGGDPIERAMRKRAEAEAKAAATKSSVVGSAMEKAAAAAPLAAPKREPAPSKGRTFYEPLSPEKTEPEPYEPEEPSFFAPSAEERAEQARRAAQRVRRRARGEEPDPTPEPEPTLIAGTSPSAPKPQAPALATDNSTPARQPEESKPISAADKKPSADLISRSGEAIKPTPLPTLPKPKGKLPTLAKVAASVPLLDRANARRAKSKSTETVTAPSAPKVTQPKPPQPVRTSKAQAPTAHKTTPSAQSTPQPIADSFEWVYADTPLSRADEPIYAAPPAIRPAKTKAFAPFEWMIASRYLRARKKEGFVSVIAGFSLVGIALGVATLIVVMAVMTGFRETLITQIIGGSPHINVQAQTEKFETFDTIAQNIRGVPGVTYVTPVVQGQVLGTGRRGHSGVIVRGMRKGDLQHLITSANPQVTNGSLKDFEGDSGVAVGANLAAKLGLRVGDFISLISPDGDITPFQATPMPRKKDYKIIYTFKLGVQQIDYNMAFMPFEEAQIYFNKQGAADTLDVFVEDAQDVEKYSDPIFQSARSSISLYNWKTQNGSLIGAINLERQVMFVILTMIILVAALNIISGLVMLVKDKSRDVAIMRTMGMARGSILRIFFICGSSIGVVGSFLGVLLGVLFVWNIKSVQTFVEWATGTKLWDESVRAGITEIPTKMQFGDVALTLFIALGLSFLATLYPAWKAAKLDPVEALRYE